MIFLFYRLLQLKIHALILSSGPMLVKQNSSLVAKQFAVFVLGFSFSSLIIDSMLS